MPFTVSTKTIHFRIKFKKLTQKFRLHILFTAKEGVVQEGEPTEIKAAIYTNMALCYMRLKNYAKAQDAVSVKSIE